MKKILLAILLAGFISLACGLQGASIYDVNLPTLSEPTLQTSTPTPDPCVAEIHGLTAEWVLGTNPIEDTVLQKAEACFSADVFLKFRFLIATRDIRSLRSGNY